MNTRDTNINAHAYDFMIDRNEPVPTVIGLRFGYMSRGEQRTITIPLGADDARSVGEGLITHAEVLEGRQNVYDYFTRDHGVTTDELADYCRG